MATVKAAVRRPRTNPIKCASAQSDPLLAVLPITARIAAEGVQLDAGFHKDPADRIIVATARCHALRLATADDRIHRWGKVPLI